MSYLGTLLLLSLLVLIHEAGHLLAAKRVGIPVAGFSVGLGPKVWSWWWGWTEYSLRLLPLGGFVVPAVAGDDEFRAIPLRKRLPFFLGGPLANLAVALPLFAARNVARDGFSWSGVLIAPFAQVAAFCGDVLRSLPSLFAKPEALSGVVGIVVEGGRLTAAGRGLELALSLTVSLAVLNLLPIPVLDGGQIVMSCLEKLFPRAVRLRVPLTVLGMVVLAAVMLYANVHDVVRLWG
ncbi:MAG TPA: site-2 protease family protein [Thermoanaerobaculia bacterium]|jgi:regulator of sigma E protease